MYAWRNHEKGPAVNLTSSSFRNDAPIPAEFAFCRPDPGSHATLSDNRNPQLRWDGVPGGCRSLVLIVVDPDCPSVGDDVNKAGAVVPADLPRADFHHWVLVDIPPSCREIAAGECSDGVTPRGKTPPPNPAGAPAARQGVNDYTGWFASDKDMKGTYRGYDGPAPPWNDERVHRYHFQLYALDIDRCPVEGDFTVPEVRKAIEGHVLAQATLTGTYSMRQG